MQNSFGRLEHSNLKCSPIFQKPSTNQSKKDGGDPLLPNFPYNSMMRNKAAKINSNFDGISLSDVMTPVHRKDEGFSVAKTKEEKPENTQNIQNTENFPEVEVKTQSQSIFARRSGASSAFLLNYGESNTLRSPDAKPDHNQPGPTPFKPVYSSQIGRQDSNLKPQSSIFGRNCQNANDKNRDIKLMPNPYSTPSLKTPHFQFSNNNISPQIAKNLPNASQPHIKIREVIKQSDYEKKYSNKKAKRRLDQYEEDDAEQSSNSEYDSDQEISDESEESSYDEEHTISVQYAKMQNNFSSNNKNNKIKTISEVTEFLNNKNKSSSFSERESLEHPPYNFTAQSPGLNNFLSHKRYGAPRKSADNFESNKKDKKIKSIKNIVDSSISKKIKEESNKKRKFEKRDEYLRTYKLKNIEANRFTKKIVEDSMHKSFNDLPFVKSDDYDVYQKKSNDQKLFAKKRKLTRSKKSDLTRAEIQMIEKDPMSLEQIECMYFIYFLFRPSKRNS